MKPLTTYRFLLLVTFIWSFCVVALGVYTRLTEAGLGCPDWPGCYGFATIPQTQAEIAAAIKAFPYSPFETTKAWNEMLHRYVAGILGLLIGIVAWVAWRQKRTHPSVPLLLSAAVIFQATLGMWTVTMNLMPIVVMGHLIGGFTIVSALFVLLRREVIDVTHAIKQSQSAVEAPPSLCVKGAIQPIVKKGLLVLSVVGLASVAGQIMLGGWTSANYAALVCTHLPVCESDWSSFYRVDAFHPVSPDSKTYQFGVLNFEQRVTIHATHRIGAMFVTLVLLFLAFRVRPVLGISRAFVLLGLLSVQIALGVTNVVAMLPLYVAVAHNLCGLLLFLSVLWITLELWAVPTSPLDQSKEKTRRLTNG